MVLVVASTTVAIVGQSLFKTVAVVVAAFVA